MPKMLAVPALVLIVAAAGCKSTSAGTALKSRLWRSSSPPLPARPLLQPPME